MSVLIIIVFALSLVQKGPLFTCNLRNLLGATVRTLVGHSNRKERKRMSASSVSGGTTAGEERPRGRRLPAWRAPPINFIVPSNL